jgi:hypothetical protein
MQRFAVSALGAEKASLGNSPRMARMMTATVGFNFRRSFKNVFRGAAALVNQADLAKTGFCPDDVQPQGASRTYGRRHFPQRANPVPMALKKTADVRTALRKSNGSLLQLQIK